MISGTQIQAQWTSSLQKGACLEANLDPPELFFKKGLPDSLYETFTKAAIWNSTGSIKMTQLGPPPDRTRVKVPAGANNTASFMQKWPWANSKQLLL
jgi:hypothetical protein